MLRKLLNLFVIFLLPVITTGQNTDSDSSKLSLLFIGDIMGHDEQIWSAENRQTHEYNYNDVFQYVKNVISESDISIANLEVTLAGTPYSGYPQFSSPAALAEACRDAGIDCFVTANNHSADRGKKGIAETIRRLDSLGIKHTGTFTDCEARDSLYPLFLEKKGHKIALLNYTYGTNGLPVPAPCIVNPLDKELVTNDLAKAKRSNPDLVILFLHWGTEYDTIPSTIQTDLAAYFFSKGADIIIGSHPHVIQRMEWSKPDSAGRDRLVYYSLGNFVSNQRRSGTDGGAVARIELEVKDGRLTLSDAGYYLTWVYTPIFNYRKKFYVIPASDYENKPEFFSSPSDCQKMKTFIRRSGGMLNRQNENVHEIIPARNDGIH